MLNWNTYLYIVDKKFFDMVCNATEKSNCVKKLLD